MDYLSLNLAGRTEAPATKQELDLQAALFAAAGLLGLMLLGRFTLHLPLLPELMADWLFAVLPIWLVELGVTLLGAFAKRLGFIGCSALYLALITAAGVGFLRRAATAAEVSTRSSLAYAAGLWLLTMVVAVPLLGGGMLGANLWHGALVSSLSLLALHLGYGAALARLRTAFGVRPDFAQTGNRLVNRRAALRAVMTAVVAAAAYDIFKPLIASFTSRGAGKVTGGSGMFPDITGLAREITPTEVFYKVSKNPFDPEVVADRWRLEVAGQLEQPLALSYEELKRLPAVEQYATLMCISNEVGGDLLGTARWKGVRLRDVLGQARLKPGVVDIVLRAADGYADSISVERALAEPTILVYEMNGAPLTPAHGFPARLIVPGIYGMKNVKWVTRLEAVAYDFKGYWQARGWDDRAEYKTMTRIDVPAGNVKGAGTVIAGVAFAGDRGISKVEVSTDGGKSWEPAEFKAPLSPYTWVLWHKQWTPPAPGSYVLLARATDGQGTVQTAQVAPPIPDGSSGYHRRAAQVES